MTFIFTANLAGPAVLCAQPAKIRSGVKASGLDGVRRFFRKDWERTKQDMSKIRNFLKRDWQRTKEDFSKITRRFDRLRASLLGRREIDDRVWEGFTERLLVFTDKAIDEAGASRLEAMLAKEFDGSDGFEIRHGADESLQRVRLRRFVVRFVNRIRGAFENMSGKDLKASIDESGELINTMKKGKSFDEAVSEISFAKGSDVLDNWMPAGQKVLMAAFFLCVVVGVVSVTAMGFYWGATTLLGATGGSAVAITAGGMAATFVAWMAYGKKVLKELFTLGG